jgi:hypothetical protein
VRSARWSEVREWCRALLLYEHIGNPAALAFTVAAPAEVIRVLELRSIYRYL